MADKKKRKDFEDVEFVDVETSGNSGGKSRDKEIDDFVERLAEKIGTSPRTVALLKEGVNQISAIVAKQTTSAVLRYLYTVPMRVDNVENPQGKTEAEVFTLPEMLVAIKYQGEHIIDVNADLMERLDDFMDDIEETDDDDED